MTVLFKTEAEQRQHFFNIWDSLRAVTPHGSVTRKETGKISRASTEALGIIDATIPGFFTSKLMDEYSKVRTGVTYTFKVSKTGKALRSTLTW